MMRGNVRGTETHRREDVKGLAMCLERFHLAGKPCAAVLTPSPVEGADTDGISSCYKLALGLIHNDACKDAIQCVPDLIGVAQLLRKCQILLLNLQATTPCPTPKGRSYHVKRHSRACAWTPKISPELSHAAYQLLASRDITASCRVTLPSSQHAEAGSRQAGWCAHCGATHLPQTLYGNRLHMLTALGCNPHLVHVADDG